MDNKNTSTNNSVGFRENGYTEQHFGYTVQANSDYKLLRRLKLRIYFKLLCYTEFLRLFQTYEKKNKINKGNFEVGG